MYWFFAFLCLAKAKKLTLMEIYFQPPITVWKTQRISFMFWECSRLCSKKSMVSIAYCRMEIPPSTRCGTTPLSWSSIFARLMNSASISATRLNRMGGRGSPCRSPFFVEKIGLPYHWYWLLRSRLRWRMWSTQSILVKTLSSEVFVGDRRVLSQIDYNFKNISISGTLEMYG